MRNAPEAEAVNAAVVVTLPAPPDDESLGEDEAIVIKEIEVSYSGVPTGGLLTVTDGRTDANCTTSTTSPTVLDAAIEADDVNKPVSGAGIPANATVGNVVAGVSFQIMVAGVATNATAASSTASLLVGNEVDLKVDITTAGATNIPLPLEGLQLGASNPGVVTLAAGGAGITGRVNVGYDLKGI